MAVIKELSVYLIKIDYLGYGQRSADIGNDLYFHFLREGNVRIVEPDNLKHGSSETFRTPLLYKRLSEQDFPYEIDIRVSVIEEDIVVDDSNINPVPTSGFIVKRDDTVKDWSIEIEVHENGDPQEHLAVFVCHFRAELRALQGQGEEEDDAQPEEPADNPPSENGDNSPGPPVPPAGPQPIPPESPIEVPFHHYIESIVNDEMDILAFVSDTHIGADECVDDFDQADDTAFVSVMNFLNGLNCRSKELILLGDLLELWETSPHFGELNTYNEKVDAAKTKITKIVSKHKVVFDAIKTFSGNNKVTYVYGNHDDELQEGVIRNHFLNETGIQAGFGMEYINPLFEVFSQHGHQYDSRNYTTNPLGELCVGRWIVENFIVPMEKIKVNGQCGYFSPIDSFGKSQSFVDYVKCLKDQNVINNDTFDKVDDVIRNINNNIPVSGFSAAAAGLVNGFYAIFQAAGLKKEMDQFETAAGIVEKLKLGIRITRDDYTSHFNGTNRSCVLMGHTHEGYVIQLSPSKVIVNTGTWQDKMIANETTPCQPEYIFARHLTLLIRRKSTKGQTFEQTHYPEGSDMVQVLLFSVSPGNMTELRDTWYYLTP